jgi:hypothetical protein
MTNFKNLLIGFIFSCLIYSCNSNQDLEIKKENLNNKINELNKRSYNSLSDIDILILDLKNLRSEANEYIEECNKRGIQKDNSDVYNQLNSKIEDLEKIKSQKINEENEKRLNEENKQREEELLQSENQKINENNSLDLKILEFENAQKKMLNDYLDARDRNYSNSKNLRYLALEYKRYNSALSIMIKTFYDSNRQYLNSNQKSSLDWISHQCQIAIQQADIDGGAF